MDPFSLLTPERREEMKNLPPWFLQRIREALASQKDANATLEAEQARLAKFEQLSSEWEQNLNAEHDRLMNLQRDRLAEAEQEVASRRTEDSKRHGGVYKVVDDQVDSKRYELSQAEGRLEKSKEQIQTLRRQIEDLQESTRLKKEQIKASEQNKAPRVVRHRLESTVRKRLESTAGGPPSTMPAAPVPKNATSAAVFVDDGVASNTPETAIPLNQIDIDSVPPHSIYESIEELLLHPEFKLLGAVSESVSAGEQERLARLLAAFYDSSDRILDSIDFMMKEEVKRTQDVGTLFRSNSMASRMMSAYAKTIGMSYCKLVLKDTVDKIVAANENLEVDPLKFAEAEGIQGYSFTVPKEKLQANFLRIIEYTTEFLAKILQSSHLIPIEFHQICALMKEAVAPKFPTGWKIGIGGFIFLRILCPCIYRPPDEFGLEFSLYPDRAKRTLVLVAKILQNLANYMPKFGEDAMQVFGDFVQTNINHVDAYFGRLAEVPPGKPPSKPVEYNVKGVMRDLIQLIRPHQAKLLEKLGTNYIQNFTQKWRMSPAPKFGAAVHRLGTPVESLRYQNADANVDAFLTQLTTDDGRLINCILNVLDQLNVGPADEDFFADVLLQIFESRARGALLISTAAQVFVKTGLARGKVIMDSIVARSFVRWASALCRDKLRDIVVPHLPAIQRAMNDLNRRDILIQTTEPLLQSMIGSVEQLPSYDFCSKSPIWKVCDVISKEPSLGEKVVLQFLFTLMYQRVLEQPEQFGLVQGEMDRTLKKALLMIS